MYFVCVCVPGPLLFGVQPGGNDGVLDGGRQEGVFVPVSADPESHGAFLSHGGTPSSIIHFRLGCSTMFMGFSWDLNGIIIHFNDF